MNHTTSWSCFPGFASATTAPFATPRTAEIAPPCPHYLRLRPAPPFRLKKRSNALNSATGAAAWACSASQSSAALNRCHPRSLGVQACLRPFRMTRRFVEFIELREKSVDEARHPAIALGLLRPIEADEQHAGSKRVDRLAGRQQIGIFVAGQGRRQIQVLQPAIVRDRHQVQPVVLVLDRAQQPKNLAGAANIGVSFAIDDLLNRARIVRPVVKGGVHVEREKITLAA